MMEPTIIQKEEEIMERLKDSVFKQMTALEKDHYLIKRLRTYVKNRDKQ